MQDNVGDGNILKPADSRPEDTLTAAAVRVGTPRASSLIKEQRDQDAHDDVEPTKKRQKPMIRK